MSHATLAISALGSLVTAFLYMYVGQVLSRRTVSDHARLAQGMFVLFWQSLGGIYLLGVAVMAVYVLGRLEIWMFQAYVTFVLLVIFAALWGLQFYLVYLYTGSRRSFGPLGAFYAVLFLVTLALIEYIGAPERITDNGWTLETEPDVEFGNAFNLAFTLLLVGPQIVAAIAYARLYRKTSDRTQRYRIAMVTGAILVWFGSSILASAADLGESLSWQLTSRLIAVGGALTILAAYKPPHWVRIKYGIHGIDANGGKPLEAGGAPPQPPLA